MPTAMQILMGCHNSCTEECLHTTMIVGLGLHREKLGFTVVRVGFVVN